ncbi:DMT family transporter [Paenibacillus humicola]|uniref:DMT family transporter n=1 Tax=Paenibacillus humicola TaxID=3110540 RepID=UPI00237ABFA1|nr:DMT family transporter [Paenibacillus humicola]
MKKSLAFPLAVALVAISFSAIFVKWSDAPSTVLSMYRMLFASILMLPIVWKKRAEFKKIAGKERLFLLCSGFFLAMHFALWFESLKLTTVANSTIILALQPIVSLIGGFFLFKERTTAAALVTMGIATAGAMMIGWGDLGVGRSAILGDISSFLSVVAVVGYLFIGQSIVKKVSHWIYSFCVFLSAALFLTVYNVIAGSAFGGYSARNWGIFLLLAIVPTMAHVINNWLLNYINATTISMSVLGEPVGATALAAWLLGESVVGWQIAGGLLVLLGVFLFLILKQKPSLPNERASARPLNTD